MNDLISRQQALKEMWKALYEYEDKTEKQFQESKDLDVRDWIMNDRLWVQNGHNLCVNVLVNLPSAQTGRKKGKWLVDEDGNMECPFCGNTCGFGNYCNECGADLRGE